jgi:superoxide dismutase
MNSMLEGHPLGVLASNSNAELRQLTAKIDRETDFALFNNCAQVLNHMFFFESIDPEGGGEPTDIEFIHRLSQDFGSVAAFKKKFTAMALDNFGSGWTWLIQRRVEGGARREKFEIVNTDDADTMLTDPSVRACLVCDVWEHAYYIDYRNDRAGYMKAFWNLVNWEHIMAHQWTNLELRDDGEKSSDDGELLGSPDPYDYNHNCLEDSWYDNNGLDKITGKPPKKDNE